MIDKSKIKSAAQGYCDATYGTLNEHPLIAEAFREGANWVIEQLSNLWHHKSEIPDGRILYIDNLNFPHGMDWFRNSHYDEDWDAVIDDEQIKGWIYVEDLLPMMKKCLE